MDVSVDIKHVPLCVDLDGTLVVTDTLWEGLARLFLVFLWVLKGKAYLKQKVASYSDCLAEDWPIRQEVLDYIWVAKKMVAKFTLLLGLQKRPPLKLQSISEFLMVYFIVMNI